MRRPFRTPHSAPLQQHYSDRQIVEAITLTGNYFLIARLTTVLNVPLDPAAGDAVLRAGLAMHSDRWAAGRQP